MRSFFKRFLVFASVFAAAPAAAAVVAAALRPSSPLGLAVSAFRFKAREMVEIGWRAPVAAGIVAAVLAAGSLLAWSDGDGATPWRAARVTLVLWTAAIVLYPTLAAWVPVLRDVPWVAVVFALAAAGTLAFLYPRRARPHHREIAYVAIATAAFLGPSWTTHRSVRQLAARSFDAHDVVLLGFDSIPYEAGAALLDEFQPSHGRKIVYRNAWTSVATTSVAWRSILSGKLPGPADTLPGSRWPGDPGSWVPAQAAARGYAPRFVQDDAATNTFRADESIATTEPQGWKLLIEEFSWKAAFPLSVAGGRWWMSLVGGPVDYSGRYAYCPDCFSEEVFRALGESARRGPLLFAAHHCYAHAVVRVKLREFLTLDRWWARSARNVEGSGMPIYNDVADATFARIRTMTAHVRGTLERLDREGVLGRANVLILSDHGPRGPWSGFELTNHVMLAAFLPGDGPAVHVDTPVSLADLAPTLRRLIDLPPVSGDGVPLPVDGNGDPERFVRVLPNSTEEAAGIHLDKVTPQELFAAIHFEDDGTFSYAQSVSARLVGHFPPPVLVGGVADRRASLPPAAVGARTASREYTPN